MKVLLATDGMPHTDRAVEYAIDYAFRYRAELFVVYALSPGRDQRAAYAEGRETVQGIKQKALTREVGVTTMLEAGEPAEAVVRRPARSGRTPSSWARRASARAGKGRSGASRQGWRRTRAARSSSYASLFNDHHTHEQGPTFERPKG